MADDVDSISPLTAGNRSWPGSIGLRFNVNKDTFVTELIDFDCVCVGDPLWVIGLTAGCEARLATLKQA